MKSEFEKDQTKAEYVHIRCGGSFATVTELAQFDKIIACKCCGHTEQHIIKKRIPGMVEVTPLFIGTYGQLQELAEEAKENWLFDQDTDPSGKIAAGLDVILNGDVEDSEVADVFQKANFPLSGDKWDALEDWAQRLV